MNLLQPQKDSLVYRLSKSARALSLDVVSGAVASGWMAHVAYTSPQPLTWLFVLALSVWGIYTADHLLDAIRLGASAQMYRHQFHHKYFSLLAVLGAMAGLGSLALAIWALDAMTVKFGIAMAAVAGLHLGLVKLIGRKIAPWVMKELGVALVYAFGIWGLPLIASGKWESWPNWLPVITFFLIGMINLFVFSSYEAEKDAKDGQASIALGMGLPLVKKLTWVLGVGAWGLIFLGIYLEAMDGTLAGILFLMASVQLVILSFPLVFSLHERYRIWGDAAFSLPFIYVLIFCIYG